MNVPLPSAQTQLRFLKKIQRLLEEGVFTSTYKFALLIALADISVEKGRDSVDPLSISSREIAEKFVQLYWRQAIPFPAPGGISGILFQNTDRQAAVINKLVEAHGNIANTTAKLKHNTQEYKQLITEIAQVVRTMPLWKLQRVGSQVDDFLYENLNAGSTIELRPGVAYCFRQFHGQILNMVQGAWIRWVRRLQKNQSTLGQAVELGNFLFGKDRATLSAYVPLLKDLQHGCCFYCNKGIKKQGEVDHFIPWSKYPVDLGHNFVLAHKACNGSKGDLLAAIPHLEKWLDRNAEHEKDLATFFVEQNLSWDMETTLSVARWSYRQAEDMDAHLWLEKRKLLLADHSWAGLLG